MVKRASRRRTSTAESDQRPTGREVIGFVERFLRIPDGPNAGRPLVLAPWQKGAIHNIYDGRVRRASLTWRT
jgi:phage terminase large subunit-like protein